MSEKPSYLGLLNAISLAESEAERYLDCWAATTPSADVRRIISTVALREGEHGKAFAKRICELGFGLQPKEGPSDLDSKMAIVTSTTLSDKEKFEKLKLAAAPRAGERDIFTSFFDDTTMDIQTGALMGRYVAEERDSGRMLRGCYEVLCSEDSTAPQAAVASLEPLSAQLGRIEVLLEKLVSAQC